jgi:hypothetical protein
LRAQSEESTAANSSHRTDTTPLLYSMFAAGALCALALVSVHVVRARHQASAQEAATPTAGSAFSAEEDEPHGLAHATSAGRRNLPELASIADDGRGAML